MQLNKIVIGVSGGPDSMYLLNKLISNKKTIPIVVHINYYFRDESSTEEEFLKKYCEKNNIDFYSFDARKYWEKFSYLKNKQSIAREIRYHLFEKVAIENNCQNVFIAHHKDDFIETAIMQEKKSNSDYLFYGIKTESKFNKIKIYRPLLNEWKKDILNFMDKNNLEYKIDKTNFENLYERNKIRNELSKLNIEEKEKIYDKFSKINDSKIELRKSVDIEYNNLISSDLDWNYFNSIPNNLKKYVIYNLLINQEKRINISSDKIDGIIDFLKTKNNKNYRLMEKIFMSIKYSKIIICEVD